MKITIFEYKRINNEFKFNKYVFDSVSKNNLPTYSPNGLSKITIPDSWFKPSRNKNGYVGGNNLVDLEDIDYFYDIYAFFATPSEDEKYLKEVENDLKEYLNNSINSLIKYKEEKIADLKKLLIK